LEVGRNSTVGVNSDAGLVASGVAFRALASAVCVAETSMGSVLCRNAKYRPARVPIRPIIGNYTVNFT